MFLPAPCQLKAETAAVTAQSNLCSLLCPASLQEAALLASLRHPNVVNFFGICREPPCIVTEFCSRGSLSGVLANALLDPRLAAALTWERRLAMVRQPWGGGVCWCCVCLHACMHACLPACMHP